MTKPQAPAPVGGEVRTAMTRVFVTGLKVQAEIGVYRHEIGKRQPLVVDVELDVPSAGSARLAETVNYESILQAARDIADQGHIELVESFADRLAQACMADSRVTRARVRVEKPLALAPDAVAAGVEIVVERV
jgi:dihydroneopterin aldolase